MAGEAAKWALRQVYYKEKTYFLSNGKYTESLTGLGLDKVKIKDFKWPPVIKAAWNVWEANLESEDGSRRVFITHDGRVGVTAPSVFRTLDPN
jgi:hypothetical protein